ncbi:ATP-binding protein [Falsiroseomonas sp. HW251]|uniref:ATP-binding protein n=1 Tax=Falsiroseomonas sp. HW251 TaxID=3390998 RepID=UPI003D31E242
MAPEPVRIEREVPLATASVAALQDEIASALQTEGVEEIPTSRVRLVIEELSANLIMHGRFESEPALLRIAVTATASELVVTLDDAAAPFDPRETTEPAAPGLDDDKVGGLGLALIRRISTIRDYRRLPSGWNRTEIAIPRAPKGRA